MNQLKLPAKNCSQARLFLALLGIISVLTNGCSVKSANSPGSKSSSSTSSSGELSGTIRIDGSSTVLPITKAVAEDFMKLYGKVQVPVGSTGTGGGFKKFALGEIDINDASRPITEAEKKACRENKIEYVDLKVAIDGLTVVVNPNNDWCSSLTVEQLKKIWEPNSVIQKWSDLKPEWPAEKMQLYGPDTASGTFDYFTEAVVGKAKSSRTEYVPNADDNILVAGVAGDKFSLGYFGYAYYLENKDKLKAIGVAPNDKPDAPVLPSDETIKSEAYTPLSRPLFLYVNKRAMQRPEVAAFLKFYLNEGQKLVHEVGYTQLNDNVLNESKAKVNSSGG